ncbi:spore germination protein [Bacillus infantis]|uniref:Spore germination protein n=1 Tax=Bacillus infantis TaxID=324767 RepID=A0A5D4R8C6_9BACI|nr:spore germination protein [Bacillus infantis]TYS46304.1 spore germination protein [Bacillus infantis]
MFKGGNKREELLRFLKEKAGHASDTAVQELKGTNFSVYLFYIKSICDTDKIQEQLVMPFFQLQDEAGYKKYICSLSGISELEDRGQALKDLMRGSAILLFRDTFYILQLKKYISQGVKDATVETTIQGPQTALSEDLGTNLNIIRHRYHKTSLTVEENEIGSVSGLGLLLLYDKEKIEKDILHGIKDKIESIKASQKIVQSAGEIHRMLTPREKTLFPVFMITERTDRIALNLAQGKIVILIEGSPFGLILPAVFFDFMSSMEDLYQPYWVSRFLITLRYLGLLISLLLPGLYVAITSYNPEVFQVQLALGIAGSRSSVPYPSYLEVLFMLIMMELLTEASIRLPKSIGSTATTVGGLILGQAATEAGLVSNIMIIIVSAVAISNFVIPINEMSFSMRVMKYIILLLAAMTGMIGLVIGLMGLLLFLVRLDSFGKPYLKMFFGEGSKQ